MYAWPLLQTLLSEVLTKEEWLRAWDNIFSNHPSFLLFVVVAYVTVSRKALLQCTRKEDFEVRIDQLVVGFDAVGSKAGHLKTCIMKCFLSKNVHETS